jgi:hypothetical protein
MKVGDLVTYSGSQLVGVVTVITKRYRDSDPQACTVQWSNGQTTNHSACWLIKLETSENT